MKVVWKLALSTVTMQTVTMPVGAQIIHVREQHGSPCIWFECDDEAPKGTTQIAMCGTGWDRPPEEAWKYIGTVHLDNGNLVFHLYERTE